MAIRPLPTPAPSRASPSNFSPRADATVAALPGFVDDANALAVTVNEAKDVAIGAAGTASTAADIATTAKNDAVTAKNDAVTAKNAAVTSAAAADADAIVAANHASSASASATSAGNSATSATASATSATSSKNAAATSESNAAASAASALSSKNAAATSETNAISSASSASTSATSATASALTAVNAPGTSATSAASNTIGTGAKTFTIQSGKAFAVGQFIVAANTAAPANFMIGQITAHNSGTGSITINVAGSGDTGGSGTFTDWTLALTAYTSVTPSVPADGSITNGKLANMAQATFKMRAASAGTGPPIDGSATQAKAALAITTSDISGLGSLATQSGTFSGTSSGNNSGDQTNVTGNAGTATALQTSRNIDGQAFNGTASITVIAPGTHAATAKTAIVDADEFPIVDTEAVNVLKKFTWSSLKAAMKTYTDTLYQAVSANLTALAGVAANGFIARTSAGAYSARSLVATGTGLSVANAAGVAGDPTITVAATDSFWLPAGAMFGAATNGATTGTIESTTNKINYRTLDFDAVTQEFAWFNVRMPKRWNGGAITAIFTWTATGSLTNGVVWGIAGGSLSDTDTIDTALGTAQNAASDAHTSTALKVQMTSATGAMTIAGSPASEDWCYFRVHRDPADGGDTLAVDASLIGVTIYYGINALTDA